jgi:hypothetical protein
MPEREPHQEAPQREVKLGLTTWIAIFSAITTLLGGLGLQVGKSALGSSDAPELKRIQEDVASQAKDIIQIEQQEFQIMYRIKALERQQGYDSSDEGTPTFPRKKK